MSFDGAEHESGVRFWPDSPDSLDGVDVENSLVADQGQVLALRLGNQHPVKWIAMLAGKTTSPLRMLNRNRQRVKSKLLDDPAKVSNQSLSRWKLPKTVLRGDFPSGSGGDEHFVGKGCENRMRPLGKPPGSPVIAHSSACVSTRTRINGPRHRVRLRGVASRNHAGR